MVAVLLRAPQAEKKRSLFTTSVVDAAFRGESPLLVGGDARVDHGPPQAEKNSPGLTRMPPGCGTRRLVGVSASRRRRRSGGRNLARPPQGGVFLLRLRCGGVGTALWLPTDLFQWGAHIKPRCVVWRLSWWWRVSRAAAMAPSSPSPAPPPNVYVARCRRPCCCRALCCLMSYIGRGGCVLVVETELRLAY